MTVAGQKTQVLVLFQWARDAVNCSIRVAGETVVAGDQLKLKVTINTDIAPPPAPGGP